MTTIAVLADPPRPGRVLTGLVDDGPLGPDDAANLYEALLRDACLAVERSGGELLVNFRADGDEDEDDARAAVEAAVAPALDAPEDARFEVQVGSTLSARVGNTITHLLDREGVRSAAALDPRVSLLERRHVDGAAMRLRQSEVVLGPAYGGRVWYAGFTMPVDFTNVYDPPALRTLTNQARSEDEGVDFLDSLPLIETESDLASAIVEIQARELADKPVPPYTSAAIEAMDLDVDESGSTVHRR